MATSQTINTQLKTYQEISQKSAINPQYLQQLQSAINMNNVKEFNRLSGKNITKIESAKGYLRLYQSYVNIVINQTSKRVSSTKTTRTIPTKTTKIQSNSKKSPSKKTSKQQAGGTKSSKSVGSTVKINLYPFSNYSKQSGLNLIIVQNRSLINNNNRNINTILKFFADLKRNIAVYNATHSKKIIDFRVVAKYLTNLKNEAYYSTKRTDINNIEDKVIVMMNDLTLFSPQHWGGISPKITDVIYDLANENEFIVGFDTFQINYFTK